MNYESFSEQESVPKTFIRCDKLIPPICKVATVKEGLKLEIILL
jgi:hypothetical protein